MSCHTRKLAACSGASESSYSPVTRTSLWISSLMHFFWFGCTWNIRPLQYILHSTITFRKSMLFMTKTDLKLYVAQCLEFSFHGKMKGNGLVVLFNNNYLSGSFYSFIKVKKLKFWRCERFCFFPLKSFGLKQIAHYELVAFEKTTIV